MRRYIAVDWSGSASPATQRRCIVAAAWEAGVIRISSGRTRAETIAWVIEQGREMPELVVGFDFAFSYPAWFVRQQAGTVTIEDFWRLVAGRGESWLRECAPPFWGKRLAAGGGQPCPQSHRGPDWLGYRQADRLLRPEVRPKSPFQIGGAGAVGTGSIRGIPGLPALHDAGFSIWPFHAPSLPMAMEIYPRSFTGPVNKSSRDARRAFLQKLALEPEIEQIAMATEDAFDACCSVYGMARQEEDFQKLQRATDAITLLEGSIFPGTPIRKI